MIFTHLNDLSDWSGKALSGLLLAFVTSYITTRFALKRFRSEKWWELKVQNYKTIIDSLHYINRYASAVYDDQLGVTKYTEKYIKELGIFSSEARLELARIASSGEFFIDKAASNALELWFKNSSDPSSSAPIVEMAETDMVQSKLCLDKIIPIARKDLK